MSDEIIIQQLKDKELQLIHELNKVRLALKAFIDDNIKFGNPLQQFNGFAVPVPEKYEPNLTYGGKIIYVLTKAQKPLLVDEITIAIHQLEPGLELERLRKSVSHNVCMLAKYAKVKKHPFNRKLKYSI